MCLSLHVQADAENNLRKARHWYLTRCEEYEKARLVANKVEEEHSGTGSGSTHKTLDRKRRHEEEARNKVSSCTRQEVTHRLKRMTRRTNCDLPAPHLDRVGGAKVLQH